MLAALASVLLVLGSLVDVLDLSCAAAASLAVVYARIEYGAKWSAAVWLCASVVSLLLFPRSGAAAVRTVCRSVSAVQGVCRAADAGCFVGL